MYVRFSQSASYITSGYRFACARLTDGETIDAQGSSSFAICRLTREGIGNATGEVSNWEITLWHPLGTDNAKLFQYNASLTNSGGTSHYEFGVGHYNGNQAALDAIKFYPDTGTFSSGTFAIYGLSKS